MQGKPHKPIFYLHLGWWTSPAWGGERWALNFYEIFPHLTAPSVASKHPEELPNPQQHFRDFSTPYYYSQRPLLYNQQSLPTRCYSCSSRTFCYPETLFLCCLPSQASLSQPLHQLLHHSFCINPAASHKQAGSWLRKKQSREKCSRTRTSQGFRKSVFIKPKDSWGFCNFRWKNTNCWINGSYGLCFTLSFTSKVHQTFMNRSVRLNLLAPKAWA